MQIINCTALTSPNASDKHVIMHQLKPFKKNIYPKNEQVDGMKYIHDSNNAISITSRICKVCVETQNLFSDPDVCFI